MANSPQGYGFIPVGSLNSATYNGQQRPYFIQAGTAGTQQSIFTGDPVILNAAGYVESLFTIAAGNDRQNAKILGYFNGCTFTADPSLNQSNATGPRLSWTALTPTFGNIDPVAWIIDDPMVIFQAKGNNNAGVGFIQANVMKNFAIAFTEVAGVAVGSLTGRSLCRIDQTVNAPNATGNLKAIELANGDADQLGDFPGTPFNSMNVITQNHVFCSRPAGN